MGAAVKVPGPRIEKLRKTVLHIFKTMSLSKIEVNFTATEFLNVSFDLKNSTYRPIMKKKLQNDLHISI